MLVNSTWSTTLGPPLEEKGWHEILSLDEIGEKFVTYVLETRLRGFYRHSRVYLGALADGCGQSPVLIASGREIRQELLFALVAFIVPFYFPSTLFISCFP
jgi:hypothetical protein